MKIIEDRWRPGIISFLDEDRGKRSYWFNAHNLIEMVMDNEAAVELILNWTSEEVKEKARQIMSEPDDWQDFIFNHDPVIHPPE